MSQKPLLPKTQEKLSQDTITSYRNPNNDAIVKPKGLLDTLKERQNQRRVTGDKIRSFQVGIKDIDEAIFYYFNEVLRPSVVQNGKVKNVPLVYGSPERWAAMQKDGYYRDKNGKMQAPLIVFRRDNIEKNRNLGNKLDANRPLNYGIFQKKFSSKNFYDRFGILNNREPLKEYYAVAIPDYVNITYSCVVYTDYMEQNNKIIEGINFASDSYWGDPSRFKFRAMIDNFTTSAEIVQGNDRIVKTEFQINLLGHIVTDTYNAELVNSKKVYSKSSTITLSDPKDVQRRSRISSTENAAPTATFSNITANFIHPVSEGTDLVNMSISDAENDSPFSASLSGSDSDKFRFEYRNSLSSSAFIEAATSLQTGSYNYDVTIFDNAGKSRTYAGRSLTITTSPTVYYAFNVEVGGYATDEQSTLYMLGDLNDTGTPISETFLSKIQSGSFDSSNFTFNAFTSSDATIDTAFILDSGSNLQGNNTTPLLEGVDHTQGDSTNTIVAIVFPSGSSNFTAPSSTSLTLGGSTEGEYVLFADRVGTGIFDSVQTTFLRYFDFASGVTYPNSEETRFGVIFTQNDSSTDINYFFMASSGSQPSSTQ